MKTKPIYSKKSESKFRVLYIEDCDDECRKTVVEIGPCGDYAIIGNGDTLNLKDFKKDWGKNARWGRYIKLP